MNTELIGYDARLPRGKLEAMWSVNKKSEYLFSTDLPFALSVDFLVWPSIFENQIGIGLPADHKRELLQGQLPPPSWVGPHAPFWEDLHELQKYLQHYDKPHCEIIQVHRILNLESGLKHSESSISEEGHEWTLEGYDVADIAFTSGLSDCGTPVLNKEIKGQWKQRVNQRHLFSDSQDAFEFAKFIGQIIPEHQPFFPYSIHTEKS